MTAIRSSARVRFGPDQVTEVDTSIRLNSATHLACFTYPDGPPILAVEDAHLTVSISVPDPEQVTADDVAAARRLEEAVARYATELETLAARPGRGKPRCCGAWSGPCCR